MDFSRNKQTFKDAIELFGVWVEDEIPLVFTN